MPPSLNTLLIVAFAALLLGVVAGLLIGSLRGDPEEEPESPGEKSPPGGRPGRYSPVLQLWREKIGEALIVELDGKSYLSPDPLTPEQRASLEKAAGQLIGWLGAVVAPVPAEPASRATEPQPVRIPPAEPAIPMRPSSTSPTANTASDARPANLSPIPPAAIDKPVKEEPKSIVGQIDVILQEMLVRSGLDNRGISLTEDPRKGVIVWVGLNHFEGIDAVTDPEIKGIIRNAVGEWERRQEQNLRH